MRTLKVIQLQIFADLDRLYTRYRLKADIVEVSGPGACSRLDVRKLVDGSSMMDFVTTADLVLPNNRVKMQEELLILTPVNVTILAPPYHTYSARPQRDWRYLLVGTDQRRMAQLRGQLAAHQLSKGSHVLAHQLRTSELFREEPRPPILTDDRVKLAIYDRCMCELLDVGGQERTSPARDQAMLAASCWEFVWPFRNNTCLNRHRHSDRRAPSMQYGTWDEAQRVTEGIRLLFASEARRHSIVPV